MHLNFESQTHPNVTLDLHAAYDEITTDGITALILAHGGDPDSDWSVSDVRWTDRFTFEMQSDVMASFEFESDAIEELHNGDWYGYGLPVYLYDRQGWVEIARLDTSCCTHLTGPCPVDH